MNAEEFLANAPIHVANALVCPGCGNPTDVKDSRPVIVDGFITVRRRRRCGACGHRHNTIEVNSDEYERLVMLSAQFVLLEGKLGQFVDFAGGVLNRVNNTRRTALGEAIVG